MYADRSLGRTVQKAIISPAGTVIFRSEPNIDWRYHAVVVIEYTRAQLRNCVVTIQELLQPAAACRLLAGRAEAVERVTGIEPA